MRRAARRWVHVFCAVSAAVAACLAGAASAQQGSASSANSCGNCPTNYCENLGDIAKLIEEKKQAARAQGVPDRLLALYDGLAPCRACIQRASVVPRLVVIYDPQKYRAKFGSAITVADTSWNRQDEKSARDAMREGVAKEIHLIIGDSACECCKRNFTAAQLEDWRKRTNFPPDREPGRPPRGIGIHITSVDQLGPYPADLSQLPPDTSKRPPIDPGPMDTEVMPKSRIIHVVCQTCQPLADRYNDVAREINATIDEYAEAKRAAIKAQRLLQQAHDEETDAGKLAETAETAAIRARIASTVAQRARDYDQASTKAQQLADKVKELQAKLPPIRKEIADCEKRCQEAKNKKPPRQPQTVTSQTPAPASSTSGSPANPLVQIGLAGGMTRHSRDGSFFKGVDSFGNILRLDRREQDMSSIGGSVGPMLTIFAPNLGAIGGVRPFLRFGFLFNFGNGQSVPFEDVNTVPRGTGTASTSDQWSVPLLGGVAIPADSARLLPLPPGSFFEIFGGGAANRRKAEFSLIERGAPGGLPTVASQTWTEFDPVIGFGFQVPVGTVAGFGAMLGVQTMFTFLRSHDIEAQSPNFASEKYTQHVGGGTNVSVMGNFSVNLGGLPDRRVSKVEFFAPKTGTGR